jgi:hypothetical protein
LGEQAVSADATAGSSVSHGSSERFIVLVVIKCFCRSKHLPSLLQIAFVAAKISALGARA